MRKRSTRFIADIAILPVVPLNSRRRAKLENGEPLNPYIRGGPYAHVHLDAALHSTGNQRH
jgi:hypothetical protein